MSADRKQTQLALQAAEFKTRGRRLRHVLRGYVVDKNHILKHQTNFELLTLLKQNV